MAKKYVFELNGDEKLAVCNALHLAFDDARKLRDREAAMGLGKQFVLAQERHATTLQNLFFRLLNLQPKETEEDLPGK